MNICTEFGIWLRTLSSSSSGGVASRLAMRKPVMDSSLQSWCVASPFGRTFLHNLCRHYLKNLSGSSAFKSGNPKVHELVEHINADAILYDDVMSLQDKEVAEDE